jgi:hypothetical protein
MLGDITMPISRAAAAISAFCASVKPVVPMTMRTPWARQAARWASVPSGRVKSISTSAWARPWARSSVMATPLAMPSQPVASRPMAGLPRGPARRPARSRGGLHGLDQHAAHAAARTGNGDAQGRRQASRVLQRGIAAVGPQRGGVGRRRGLGHRQRGALLVGQRQLALGQGLARWRVMEATNSSSVGSSGRRWTSPCRRRTRSRPSASGVRCPGA